MPPKWVLYIFSLCSSDKNSGENDGLYLTRQEKHHYDKLLTSILTFVTCLGNNKSTKTIQVHCCYYPKWLVRFKGTSGM